LCSNSKWKIVPSLFFTHEKVDKLANLQWVVIYHETWLKKHTQMKIIQTYEWEMLNTIIELCVGLKKGLHNMLSSFIWIDIQNLLTLWQVNIITMNVHMKVKFIF
jgi:hypothetical protein